MKFSIFPPKADLYDNFQFPKRQKSEGFTVIELAVVLAIMGILIGLVVVDFARQRPERDIKIAQNQLVTNIRKVQSYSLFSRNVGNVKPAQYYILKFDTSTPDRYVIQAITDVYSAPTLVDMETVLLPKNIVLDTTSQLALTRPVVPLSVTAACALLAFKSPFGKAYMNYPCAVTSPPFQSIDSYQQIIDHLNNLANFSASTDTDLLITLSFANGGASKKVLVKGITGLVCPTVDGTTCSF
ncbi:MAG: type II secretion system protein [Candidatus Doudnabacteria bacterium]|nr:type II secretion system protein [Candidatus Doudnabacteria bacterium]